MSVSRRHCMLGAVAAVAVLAGAGRLTAQGQSPPVPQIKQADSFAYIREQTGLDWIALGEKKADNPPRLWRLRKNGGFDAKQRQVFPVANWTHGQVLSYMKAKCLMLPPEWRFGLKTSFGGFVADELRAIKQHYPDDYQKIQARFPFIEAAIKRAEIIEASDVQG